jgi:uncharacterized membrane protein
MSLKSHFKSKFITGILTVIPVGVTVFVLHLVFTTIDGWFMPIMAGVLAEKYIITGMGVLATILLVYLVGLAVSNYVGRKLVSLGEKFLEKIPIVREVYTPVKQFVQMVGSSSNNKKLKRTVAIRAPGSPVRILGFVTGEILEAGSLAPLVTVFVPTSPNPATGLVFLCDPEIVYELDMKVETAMKMIISGGIVAPDSFTLQRLINAKPQSEDVTSDE